MGHRKHNAPRHGSIAFFPRARHGTLVPRVRTWSTGRNRPEKPMLAGFPAFKVGMIHAITIDDREKTPNFGKPSFNAATVLALPEPTVYGIRVYARKNGGESAVADYFSDGLDEETKRRLSQRVDRTRNGSGKQQPGAPSSLSQLDSKLEGVSKITALIGVVPKEAGLSTARPQVQEVELVGGDIMSQVEYVKSVIGRPIRPAEFLKRGSFVDSMAITKGKGFEGPVTRFGVKRKQHKSRKSVRAVGVISPWHPATVMYTVPRAGQMGFHQRLSRNNRVLFVGNGRQSPITPSGGFLHYGEVNGDYVILKGSVPGPSKRLVDIRLPLNPKRQKIQAPRLIELSVAGKSIQSPMLGAHPP